MAFDTDMFHDTETHTVSVEFNVEGMICGTRLAEKLTVLGLIIKPNERRVYQDDSFRITIHAKSNFTPEAFFQEEQPFMDKLTGNAPEN